MRPLAHTATSRPILTALLSVAVLAGSAVPAAPAAIGDAALPVLWEGQIHNPDGRPADAEVVAYARPPADEIQEGVPLAPIASTQTDGSGRFVLRAVPSSLTGVADDGGWASVMVIATSAKGMALAVDSVSWKPLDATKGVVPFSAGAGQWVTTPQALLSDKVSAFAKSPVETPESLANERPAVLTLSDAAIAVPLAGRPAGPPPKGETHCAPTPKRKDLDRPFPVAVGELHREKHWGGEFVYTSTKSSSFQVGSSVDGKNWKMAGSASMSKTRNAKSSGYEEPTDHLVFETSYADMIFTQFTWVCGEPYWKEAYTIEPTDWTGGMRDLPTGNPATCNPQFEIPVSANDEFERSEDSSQTLQGALSVQGFVGSVTTTITGTVEATKTVSKGIAEMWDNRFPEIRYLCGESKYPTGHTRVVSLP